MYNRIILDYLKFVINTVKNSKNIYKFFSMKYLKLQTFQNLFNRD